MHPQHRLAQGYDFNLLMQEYPQLRPYQLTNEYGELSLNFGDATCVRLFNTVLLHKYFDIAHWNIPSENLFPTIPGRADYLYYLRDKLGNGSKKILDIGTGAGVIYPLLGHALFGWKFVGTDINQQSLRHADNILNQNNFSSTEIELRTQPLKNHIFKGVIKADDYFDASICNPPFYHSTKQAARWNEKKWKQKPILIGVNDELIFPGGEVAFITLMLAESVQYSGQIKYFTSLVSKQTSLAFIKKQCINLNIRHIEIIEFSTGRKKSRMLIWQV